MLLWPQGDHRMEPRGIAREKLRGIALENICEDKPCLQLRERHPDRGARATSEGKVRSGRDLLFVRRIPALWFEYLRVPPDSRQAMRDPLAQDDQRTSGQAHVIQFSFFGDKAHLQPGRWIEPHRFTQNPVHVGEIGKVIRGWLATGEQRADLILQFDTDLWIL